MEKITYSGEVGVIPFIHHKCPICESPCNEDIEQYVESELFKMTKDPTYMPKSYNERSDK
jgi:hypothetical protein